MGSTFYSGLNWSRGHAVRESVPFNFATAPILCDGLLAKPAARLRSSQDAKRVAVVPIDSTSRQTLPTSLSSPTTPPVLSGGERSPLCRLRGRRSATQPVGLVTRPIAQQTPGDHQQLPHHRYDRLLAAFLVRTAHPQVERPQFRTAAHRRPGRLVQRPTQQ